MNLKPVSNETALSGLSEGFGLTVTPAAVVLVNASLIAGALKPVPNDNRRFEF